MFVVCCLVVQNDGCCYRTTSSSTVDIGFFALWQITVITVLLLANYRNILPSGVGTDTHLFILVYV